MCLHEHSFRRHKNWSSWSERKKHFQHPAHWMYLKVMWSIGNAGSSPYPKNKWKVFIKLPTMKCPCYLELSGQIAEISPCNTDVIFVVRPSANILNTNWRLMHDRWSTLPRSVKKYLDDISQLTQKLWEASGSQLMNYLWIIINDLIHWNQPANI